jgi:hypothetical protein
MGKSAYSQFVKRNVNKCAGATPQARLANCAKAWKKAKGGVISAGAVSAGKLKRAKGKGLGTALGSVVDHIFGF